MYIRREHPNLWLANNQNAVEFCSINTRIQVLHTHPSKILPRHTNGPRTVHATPNQNHQQEIIDKYNLNDIEEDGWVYVKIVKGVYVLPGAGKIANDLLKKRLDKAG